MIKIKELRCPECRGTFKAQPIKMVFNLGNSRITVKNIPGYVCGKCGNEIVGGHAAKDIDLLVNRVSEDVDRFAKSLALPQKRHNISLAV